MAPGTRIHCLLASSPLIGIAFPAAAPAQLSPAYAADWPGSRTRCLPVPLNNVRASGFLGPGDAPSPEHPSAETFPIKASDDSGVMHLGSLPQLERHSIDGRAYS
jgi:hypothetical protein